jgi:hypothetical protein
VKNNQKKKKKRRGSWGMAQVIELLPSKCEALSSNPKYNNNKSTRIVSLTGGGLGQKLHEQSSEMCIF